MAVLSFFVWYYPIGLYRNARHTNTFHSRGFLTFLILEASFLFASSFGHMLIAGIEEEQIASSIATLLSVMSESHHIHQPHRSKMANVGQCTPSAASSPAPATSLASGSSCTVPIPSPT